VKHACQVSLAAIRHIAPELRSSGSRSGAPAAFNGLSDHLMYGAICVPGLPNGTDRIMVNAAIESLWPAVVQ